MNRSGNRAGRLGRARTLICLCLRSWPPSAGWGRPGDHTHLAPAAVAAPWEHDGVLTLQFNDEALRLLGVLDGQLPVPEPSLTDELEQVLTEGIIRRGSVLVWTGSSADADAAPGMYHDLTGWECAHSSFHVEDYLPVSAVTSIDGTPDISEPDQRLLLTQALIFAARFARLVFDLAQPPAVRCIINANETCSTFRFNQIRSGEHWNLPDLDTYKLDKMILVDIGPATPDTPRANRDRQGTS